MSTPKRRTPSSLEREVIQLRLILLGAYTAMKALHPIHFDSGTEYGRFTRNLRQCIKEQLKLKDDE